MKTDFEGTQRTETDENIVSDRVSTNLCQTWRNGVKESWEESERLYFKRQAKQANTCITGVSKGEKRQKSIIFKYSIPENFHFLKLEEHVVAS